MPHAIVLELTEDGFATVPSDEVQWGEPEPEWPRQMRRRFKRVFQYHLNEHKMPPDMAHFQALKKLAHEIPEAGYNQGRRL